MFKWVNLKNLFKKENKKEEVKKEDNMAESEYGSSKEILDYKKVQDKLNSYRDNPSDKNNFSELKDVLIIFKNNFLELSQEEKNKELDSKEFNSISNDINKLKKNNKGIYTDKLKDIIKDMKAQKGLSIDEKIDKICKNIDTLSKTLERIEKEDIKIQGQNIQDIASSTDKLDELEKSINNLKIDIDKISKEKSTLNLTHIENKISNLEKTHNSKSDKIVTKIDNIKYPIIPTNYLKEDDFKFELKNKFDELKDLKELAENLETVPAKVNSIEKEIKSLSEKMDNLPSQNSSTSNSMNIPKEEKSIIDLAKYMNDGVAQFENIAKEYVSKIQELEKFEKAKAKHKEELEKVRIEAVDNGKKEGQISLIIEIAKKFPSSFNEIKSSFEKYITEQFKKDEKIEITNESQNTILSYLDGEVSLGNYRIVTPVILIDNKIIIKAKVEEIKEKENQDG